MMIFKLKLHPTAGFIPNISMGACPGIIGTKGKQYLRDMAKKVAEYANNPSYKGKRELWYKHNSLEKCRPMMLVFPEDSWFEIMGVESLNIEDPYWREWEWYFKHLIYRHERLDDDFVLEPEICVPSVVYRSGWGVEVKYIKKEDKGSYTWEPPIKEERDLERMKYPEITVDDDETKRRYEMIGDIFGDILPVRTECGIRIEAGVVAEACALRGLEQVMLDIYDRPEWLHEFLTFIAEGNLRNLIYLEEKGYLTLNNRNHYTDSGGIGYTKDLPSKHFNENVTMKDLWIFGAAQEFSEVSPLQHEEFGLKYQKKIFEKFGLVSCGCCEPYTHKFEIIKKIPNLRRVSVSPWCDINKAVEELEDKYIYSWKPNPAYLAMDFDSDFIRRYIRNVLQTTKGCIMEIILKDTITAGNKPEKFEMWNKILREEIDELIN